MQNWDNSQDVFWRTWVITMCMSRLETARGWAEYAPYDAILVTAAAPQVPRPLLEQLADGGCLVIPVGARGNQTLERWVRVGDEFMNDILTAVAFVPLLGEFGWQE